MADHADSTPAPAVHRLEGSTPPGAGAVMQPFGVAAAGPAATHPDAAVIDLAERVKALIERQDRVHNRMLDILERRERWEFANRPKPPEPLPSELTMVRSRTDTHEVLHIEQPLRALAEQKAQREAFEAALAAHNAEKKLRRAGTREPYLDKLQARMWRRIERLVGELTRTEPRTRDGIAAKTAALLALNVEVGIFDSADDLSARIITDTIRIFEAEADARAEQDRQDRQADGELLSVGRAWQDCADLHEQAANAASAIEKRLTRPAPPEALFHDPQTDASVIGSSSRVQYGTDRRWYGEPEIIERMRGQWPHAFCQERRDAIVAAYDGWVAATQAEEDAAGLSAAEETAARLSEENRVLRQRVLAIPAQTLYGLQLKMSVARWCLGDLDGMEFDLQAYVRSGDADDEAFALAVTLDACRILCRDAARRIARPADIQPAPASSDVADRRAVAAYAEWLDMETKLLSLEMYPQGGDQADRFLPMNTAAKNYRFPIGSGMAQRELPQPTSRAEATCRVLGIDWTTDGAREEHRTPGSPATDATKAA